MELLNPANLNYWQQILKNKDDIAMLKETSSNFTYAVGLKLSIKDMPFDVNNETINKSTFTGYIINKVYKEDSIYTLPINYNNKIYTTDMFIFFGTVNGLYLLCFPEKTENDLKESILYLGKWNEESQTYEYCNQITTDLADAIQELTESLSNYQTKLTFDTSPTLGSNNPVTSDGVKQAINEVNNSVKNEMTWKFLGKVDGQNTISISDIYDNFNDIKIVVTNTSSTTFPISGNMANLSMIISKPELTALTTNEMNYFMGARYSGTYGVGSSIVYKVANKTFNVQDMYFNEDVPTSNYHLFIWYR